MNRTADPSSAHSLFTLEQLHAATGRLPTDHHPFLEAFIAHFRDWDAKRCESIILQNERHPIIQIRSLLFRGRLAEAQEVLKAAAALQDDPFELSELLVEQSRIAALNGDWITALDLISEISPDRLLPLSRLGLLQIQALAFFETGDMTQALTCLAKVDSLSTSFPNCSASVYARILEIRILARDQGAARAWKKMRQLWSDLKRQGRINRNLIQALLRAEIDLCRIANVGHFDRAVASLLIAESMGESLYAALAVLDCYVTADDRNRKFFANRLEHEARTFSRVQSLCTEIFRSTEKISSTGRVASGFSDRCENSEYDPARVVETLVLADANIALRLMTGQVIDTKPYPQLVNALRALNGRTLSKSELFATLWGSQKYVPALHDGLMFGLQQRLKTKMGIKLSIRNSGITIPTVLLLDDGEGPR